MESRVLPNNRISGTLPEWTNSNLLENMWVSSQASQCWFQVSSFGVGYPTISSPDLFLNGIHSPTSNTCELSLSLSELMNNWLRRQLGGNQINGTFPQWINMTKLDQMWVDFNWQVRAKMMGDQAIVQEQCDRDSARMVHSHSTYRNVSSRRSKSSLTKCSVLSANLIGGQLPQWANMTQLSFM